MSLYDKVATNMNFVAREEEVLKFWQESQIFQKSVHHRDGCPPFTFFDGPPTANGKPHIGHIETRAIKDLIPRYKSMKGYNVLRKAGWDTHGLPVELEVEKQLGINGKPQIEAYGVEPFIQKCKQSVWKYENEWRLMSERVGFWADMDDPYVTYHNNYIESEWWALKTIFDKGLLYKGHKVVPYCPRCGTALSSHEVAQGYQDVTETSVFVKFRVPSEANTFLLAWTTTPWTLPSNVALVVNAHEDYVHARKAGGDEIYILAKALCESVLGEGFEVLSVGKGEGLVGLDYEPLYPFAGQTRERGWYVVADDYVTLTEGTGIVHTAPAFGEDDARVGRENKLPFVQLVNTQGQFVESVTPWKGLFVKDADPLIVEELRASNKLFAALPYTHSYPFCWRCDTPLLYYARSGWFIRMTELREQLLKNNDTVHWLPEHIKDGRFGNFLDGVIDWALSRERYWGTPLPVWSCECGHLHAVGSIAELRALGTFEDGSAVPEDIELHKPYVDKVVLRCPECGGLMHRTPEVIDCWFDSGAMPFAQWHYPFENKEIFEQRFPADFISEALDQTRGWFYSLMAISTLLFDQSPFRNCLVLGLVADKDGQKMSKHKGNVVEPWSVLNKQGADAARWYFYASAAPWLPSRFYDEAVGELQRRYMGTLWNTYAFYILYANLDNFNPYEHTLRTEGLGAMDRWLLSGLNTLIKTVDEHLEHYRVTEAARALMDFVDELSNWYVRRGRERYWQGGMPQDKIDAYMTLFTALKTLALLSAPFTPFLSEAMYQNMVRKVKPDAPESIHLCDYPVYDASRVDSELEREMALARSVVELGRAARNTGNRKNRQPLAEMFVVQENDFALNEELTQIVTDELNVKKLSVLENADSFTEYKLKPQLRTLGRRYGKLVPAIGQALTVFDGHAAVAAFKAGESLHLDIEGTDVVLAESDVLLETGRKEGYASESANGLSVVLDIQLTPELLSEGRQRELIRQIQTLRKDAGFEVQDRIHVYLTGLEPEWLESCKAKIAKETLALSVELADAPQGATLRALEEGVTLAVQKA